MLSVVKVDGNGYDLKTLEPLKHLDRIFRFPTNYEKFKGTRGAAPVEKTPELEAALDSLHIAKNGYEEDAVVAELQKFDSAQNTEGYATVDYNEESSEATEVNFTSEEMIFGHQTEPNRKSTSTLNNFLKLNLDLDPTGRQEDIYLSNFNLLYRKLRGLVKDQDYHTVMNQKVSALIDIPENPVLEFIKGLRVIDFFNYDLEQHLQTMADDGHKLDMPLRQFSNDLAKALGEEFFTKHNLASSPLFNHLHKPSVPVNF